MSCIIKKKKEKSNNIKHIALLIKFFYVKQKEHRLCTLKVYFVFVADDDYDGIFSQSFTTNNFMNMYLC